MNTVRMLVAVLAVVGACSSGERTEKPGPTKVEVLARSPAPRPPAEVDFHACTADADCELFCPQVDGCCGWTCGCSNAINRAHREAYDRHYEAKCRKRTCPAVACRRRDFSGARCVNNRCEAVEGL